MEDADGLSFDFEGGLDSGPSHSFSPGCSTRKLILRRRKPDTKLRSFLRDGSRSWKRTGLPSDCLQTLASRSVYESRSLRVPPSVRQSSYAYLPVLPVTRECREQDCVYKHTNADIKECNMYVLLFDSTLCNESDCVCFLVWSCRVMKAYGLYLLMQWMGLCLVLSFVLLFFIGTSLGFVRMVLTVGTGMRSCLDLHLQLRKFFRRYSNWLLTIMGLTGSINHGTLLRSWEMLSLRCNFRRRDSYKSRVTCNNNNLSKHNIRSARLRHQTLLNKHLMLIRCLGG